VSYRVEFGGGAQVQFHTVPKDAREALIELLRRRLDVPARPMTSHFLMWYPLRR